MPDRSGRALAALGLCAAALLAGVWWSQQSAVYPLVVYCAHDAVFSESVLRQFEQQTGIPVDVRFDTEATKSLGLVQRLVHERDHPRCDVFWNNELLGTLDLGEQNLLEPYHGAGWERMPQQFRDPQGRWVGFGARLRVWIVNTSRVSDTAVDPAERLLAAPQRAAFAQPLFGTTLTHYTVLWDQWGPDRLQQWHRDLRDRGLREVPGNGLVKDLVATGQADLGATDTDDVFVALDARQPVSMTPVRIAGRTIAIPNTVAIIQGTKHRAAAERLVDYLTSAETELQLARSAARQVPLGPVNETQLPAEVAPLIKAVQESVDLRGLLPARRAVLEWLRSDLLL
jgi:iron(III) transport system substrate-binding protein